MSVSSLTRPYIFISVSNVEGSLVNGFSAGDCMRGQLWDTPVPPNALLVCSYADKLTSAGGLNNAGQHCCHTAQGK